MDTQVILALIALFASTIAVASPIVVIVVNNKNVRAAKEADAEAARAQRLEDYARQDAVADKAEKAAQRLIERQDVLAKTAQDASDKAQLDAREAAKLILAANEKVDQKAGETNVKLEVIHTLVNSNYTAALQAELDATRGQLVALKEIADMKLKAGLDPSAEATAEIAVKTKRIEELKAILAERLKTAQVVEMQLKPTMTDNAGQEIQKVADDRTGKAVERIAVATEESAASSAAAVEKVAIVAETLAAKVPAGPDDDLLGPKREV